MATVYKQATGEYIETLSPLTLTDNEESALDILDEDAQAHADSLSATEGTVFKVGRPDDRHPSK